jgi:deoxyribodipyrimidine photo-lyase
MWLASYVVHLRHVHWRAGADWLVAHLLDGDLASNHLSWQWVAGTGSHKPYLFNADNVARYAPEHWHSSGTAVDQSYEALDRIERGPRAVAGSAGGSATPEPPLLQAPPADLALGAPTAAAVQRLQGRPVWLVHPWALRAPPADAPEGTVAVGVYLREHHQAWPWPAARWRWVDAAMDAVATERWFLSTHDLRTALAGAASVRSVSDPHIAQQLQAVARLNAEPALFPPVERPCSSFSQWWTRSTRGLQHAQDLL